MKEIVSIIVPVFNSADCIGYCIKSIINQTYKDFELIIVDDGSTDDTANIIKKYANKYSNIIYHYQKNAGPSVARNCGLDLVKGKFILFVDADDWIDKKMVAKMIKVQKETNADYVIANHIRHDKGNTIFYKVELNRNVTTKELIKNILLKKIKVGCCGKLYKKQFLDVNHLRFPTDRYGEDIYFIFKIAEKKPVTAWIGEGLYHVVNRNASICNVYSPKFLLLIDTLDDIHKMLVHNNYWSENIEALYNQYYLQYIMFLLNYGIKHNKRAFINYVKQNNKISSHLFKIEKQECLKGKLLGLIFKYNIDLYCKTKQTLNLRKRLKK